MLKVFAFFHLNLMFSSIEREARRAVIETCYWPALRLAEDLGLPLGIEAPAWTLAEIERLDPAWINYLRRLIDRGLIEFIGSGYAQAIGPLMPAKAAQMNLALGQEDYARLLGVRPRLALVNEQAFSDGLVPHYARVGYDGLLMDYDMCAHARKEWPRAWRYHPQRVVGQGERLALLWTSTVIFQKLQRLAHDDMTHEEYLAGILEHAGDEERLLCLYSNDAEVFDFRPGRFQTEAAVSTQAKEWDRVRSAFEALNRHRDVAFVRPSEGLDWQPRAAAFNEVRLGTAAFPIPVKKQMKYNASRWAVSGRSDFELNSRCRRLTAALGEDADPALWRRLLFLWSSDLRTHITESRWHEAMTALDELERTVGVDRDTVRTRPGAAAPAERPDHAGFTRSDRYIDVRLPGLEARVKLRKGLALEWLAFPVAPDWTMPVIGTIRHGNYDDLRHAFDWFSGTLIAEFVGRPKVTDLAHVEATVTSYTDGRVVISAEIPTSLGAMRKVVTFASAAAEGGPFVHWRYRFDWPRAERASLRLGNLTLLPGAFDGEALFYRTHNGGWRADEFALDGQEIDHGAHVSFQVSAMSGAGMTEGVIEFGDKRRVLRLAADDPSTAFLALVAHRTVRDKHFTRISLSAEEIDETWRPSPTGGRPLDLAFSLSPVRP